MDSGGPKEYVLDRYLVLIPHRKGMTSGFSHMPPSTIPSGPDVGISLLAVSQHSSWPAAEVVEYHVKFSE